MVRAFFFHSGPNPVCNAPLAALGLRFMHADTGDIAMDRKEGGCACGEARYTVSGTPLFVQACHCSFCQRQTGGPHVINAIFETDRIALTAGKVDLILTPSPSGKGQKIARCPTCQTALWSHYDFGGYGDYLRFLRVGTLDDPKSFPPDIHIFTSSKQPWYVIPPEHRAVEAYYDLRREWPPSSEARFRKLRDAVRATKSPD